MNVFLCIVITLIMDSSSNQTKLSLDDAENTVDKILLNNGELNINQLNSKDFKNEKSLLIRS